MNYRLIVITHGDAPAVERVLDAFARHVHPAPVETVVVLDGRARRPQFPPDWPHAPTNVGPRDQRGFCSSMRYGWEAAVAPGVDHVFWLENDFVIRRDLDLRDLAAVLDTYPRLAQMALMRNAVNAQEKAAGGLYESRPGQWEECDTRGVLWLEEREFLTTNPSLMRRDFMVENPWPDDGEPYCEGRFGIALRERGYTFGFMGRGEVWVEHVGIRDGHGY